MHLAIVILLVFLAVLRLVTFVVADRRARGVKRPQWYISPLTSTLRFADLRNANLARLPLFKNGKGEPAHDTADGSDWSPGDWVMAVTGELGEAANIMKKLRRGDYTLDDRPKELKGDTVREALAKEFADVACYLDILSMQFGVDLGEAVRAKFNEVSRRIGVEVYL